MTSPGRPQDLVERALSRTRAEACVVLVEEESEANVRFANNTVTTNGVARGRTVTVVSVSGRSAGVVSRQGIGPDQIDELVEAADTSARQASPADDAAPLFGPQGASGDWDAEADTTTIGVFASFAPELGEAFRRAADRRHLLFGFAYHRVVTTYLGTSGGLRARHDQPTGHVEICAKAADLSHSTWAGVPTERFADVDVSGLHRQLERRMSWAERRIDLPAGRYDTILPPAAVADLMIYLYWSAEAREAHEGRSVFSRPGGGTRVGERLSAQPLTLRSDPGAAGLTCSPFLTAHLTDGSRSVFDNGAPLAPTSWITGGTLEALVQTRHSAGLTGLAFTPYIDNLVLESAAPAGDMETLVSGVERGLLLTCLWYIREVDPQTLLLTGLTRDGVYLVEAGEVTGAVNNYRFNESPVDLLARAAAVGGSERALPREWSDYFTRTAMPALRVPDFNMSSVSQAS